MNHHKTLWRYHPMFHSLNSYATYLFQTQLRNIFAMYQKNYRNSSINYFYFLLRRLLQVFLLCPSRPKLLHEPYDLLAFISYNILYLNLFGLPAALLPTNSNTTSSETYNEISYVLSYGEGSWEFLCHDKVLYGVVDGIVVIFI